MLNRNRTITQYLHNAPLSTVLTQGIYGGKYFCMALPPTLSAYLIEAWLGKKGIYVKRVAQDMTDTLTWLPMGFGDSIVNAEKLLEERLNRCVFVSRDPQHRILSPNRHQELSYKYITQILGDCDETTLAVPNKLRKYDLVLREHGEGTDSTLVKYLHERKQ